MQLKQQRKILWLSQKLSEYLRDWKIVFHKSADPESPKKKSNSMRNTGGSALDVSVNKDG